jgi:hypothetical protein
MRARYGARLKYAGSEQQTLVWDFLSATPDGLLVDLPASVLNPLGIADLGGDHSLVIETADPRTKLDEPKPEHVFQVITQTGLFREVTPHRPDYALIAYTDASFWDEVTEFAVRFDPEVFQTAKNHAARIMTETAVGTPQLEGLGHRWQGMRPLPIQPGLWPDADQLADRDSCRARCGICRGCRCACPLDEAAPPGP